MAYELHIQRLLPNNEGKPTPISLDDWKAAISATAGTRLCQPGENAITNPKTGETINITRREGDAEVYFPNEQAWRSAFRWFEGAAHVNARFKPGDSSHPVWVAAAALASRLDAVIRGDEGERYDLKNGDVIDA